MTETGSRTHEDFEAWLEQDFDIALEGDTVLRSALVDVQSRSSFDPQRNQRQASSVILRGPVEPALDQNIYFLHYQTLSTLGLFLVPRRSERARYTLRGSLYLSVSTDGECLPATQCETAWREVEPVQGYLTEKWFRHQWPPESD